MVATKTKHDEPDFGEPSFHVRIVTCHRVQDGPDSSAPHYESIDIRSEALWKLLREKGAHVIAAHIV